MVPPSFRSTARLADVVVCVLVAALVAAGCGAPDGAPPSAAPTSGTAAPIPDEAPVDASCPATSTIGFAKTRFVAHAGLAFGAFHRYLWKPYRDGTFGGRNGSRLLAFAKASLAALFVKREVRLAAQDARADPALCRSIAAPLAEVGNDVRGAVDRLESGDGGGMDALNSSVAAVEGAAGGRGTAIAENQDPDMSAPPR